LAGDRRIELRCCGLEPLLVSDRPLTFQRTIKNPALGGVCACEMLRPSNASPPNDPLGHSDYSVFEGLKHCLRATPRM
jgi:hypothetical protein